MAGETKEEFAPLLRPGLHPFNVDGLKNLCVDRFSLSLTRQKIMTNLVSLLEHAQRAGMRGDAWIDGSFLTEKLNPDDVDLALVVPAQEYLAMSDKQRAYFEWFKSTNLYPTHKCDNYIFIKDDSVATNQFTHAYWMRQFGFSRGDEMKGIAVIQLPFWVKP